MAALGRISLVIALAAGLLLGLVALAQAEKRLALVIGNGAYRHVSALRNPKNDATDLAEALRSLGFEVMLKVDVDRREMHAAIDAFWHALPGYDVGLFFYAGHGVQFQNDNYLMPITARIALERDIPEEGVSASSVLNRMEDANKGLNIVLLDACRKSLKFSPTRALDQGLSQMPAPKGSIVVFATAPNEEASDGPVGKNGLFTSHLLRHIRTPGLKIEDMVTLVRIGVAEESARDKGVYKKQQIPWASSSIMGDFYFAGSRPVPQVAQVVPKFALPTGPGGVSFEDIVSKTAAQTKAQAHLEEQARARWAAWQKGMNEAVARAKALEGDPQVDPADKAEAWRRIGRAFAELNPYSDEDKRLRAISASRAEYWAAQAEQERFEKARSEQERLEKARAEQERMGKAQAEAESLAEALRRREEQSEGRLEQETQALPKPSTPAPQQLEPSAPPAAAAQPVLHKHGGQGGGVLPLEALAGVIVLGALFLMIGFRRFGYGLCFVSILTALLSPAVASLLHGLPLLGGGVVVVLCALVLIGVLFGRAPMARIGEGLLLELMRLLVTVPLRLMGGMLRLFRAG